jgi:transposase
MPKRIKIEPHLSLQELYRRYRQATQTTTARHYQTIWLLASGKTTTEVAEITGYKRRWIYELVAGYNRLGPEFLGDGRRNNSGGKPLLSDEQQVLLWQALQKPPADGGSWTGPKVAVWIGERLGRHVHPQRGWEYLKAMRACLRPPQSRREQPGATD